MHVPEKMYTNKNGGIVSSQTWHTGSKSNYSYGSDWIFYVADAAKMCSDVTNGSGYHTNEEYGTDKCGPAFVFVWSLK